MNLIWEGVDRHALFVIGYVVVERVGRLFVGHVLSHSFLIVVKTTKGINFGRECVDILVMNVI